MSRKKNIIRNLRERLRLQKEHVKACHKIIIDQDAEIERLRSQLENTEN